MAQKKTSNGEKVKIVDPPTNKGLRTASYYVTAVGLYNYKKRTQLSNCVVTKIRATFPEVIIKNWPVLFI